MFNLPIVTIGPELHGRVLCIVDDRFTQLVWDDVKVTGYYYYLIGVILIKSNFFLKKSHYAITFE